MDQRLQSVIVHYLTAAEQGQAPDAADLIRQHPELADALREFFLGHQQLRSAWGSDQTRGVLQATHAWSPTAEWRPQATPADAPSATPVEKSATENQAEFWFGDYQLLEEIGRGGMGVVYRARHRRLQREVALKMIKSGALAHADEVQRFRSEATAAAGMDHPQIVTVFEAGELQGLHFIAMALVEGETLAARLARGPLPPRQAAWLIKKIAGAIAYAHQRGIIHRDLKPGNILLDAQGEPHVTDFGLARNLHGNALLTETGQILGTPAFMAPEQARADRAAISATTDVYSLGALLYAACTGSPPHPATGTVDAILAVLECEPTPASRLNRQVPQELEQICAKALQKQSQDRYPSASALADDLDLFLKGEPVTGTRLTWSRRLRRWWRREPVLLAHLSSLLIMLLIVTATYCTIGRDQGYFLRHAGALVAWGVLCWLLQRGLRRDGWENAIRIVWGAVDVGLMTFILWLVAPPRSPLMIGYAVLIAASGFFLRVHFVLLMTALASIAAAGLTLLVPEDLATRPHLAVLQIAGLVILGGLTAAQVRRLRVLSLYFETT